MAQLKALHATEMLNALPNHEQRLKGRALRTGGLFDQVEFFYSPVKGDAVDLQQTGGFGLFPGGFVECFQGGTGIDPLRLASGRAPHGVSSSRTLPGQGYLANALRTSEDTAVMFFLNLALMVSQKVDSCHFDEHSEEKSHNNSRDFSLRSK
jgi:hypothetical protein